MFQNESGFGIEGLVLPEQFENESQRVSPGPIIGRIWTEEVSRASKRRKNDDVSKYRFYLE